MEEPDASKDATINDGRTATMRLQQEWLAQQEKDFLCEPPNVECKESTPCKTEVQKYVDGPLGIMLQPVPNGPGLRVTHLDPALAIYEELRVGDVIVSVNNRRVRTCQEAVETVANTPVAMPITLEKHEPTVAVTIAKAEKGAVGIEFMDVDSGGVQVITVVPTSAAAKAGLVAGDVLLSCDGTFFTDHTHAVAVMEAAPAVFQVVKVDITEAVTVHKAEDGSIGIVCVNSQGPMGVEVQEVNRGSAAEAAGLLVGDILLSCNGTMIYDHSHAVELMGQSPAEAIEVVRIIPGRKPLKESIL